MSNYQSKYTGAQVENVLDNAILKIKQSLTDEEKNLVKDNLGITEPDLSEYATKEEVQNQINSIPTPDVSGQISQHNLDEQAHPFIQNELKRVQDGIPTNLSQLHNDANYAKEDTVAQLVKDEFEKLPEQDVSGQISAALVDYVKKVEGKGLSTNDFTNELKTKLEGITPYDPSELEAEISKLETALNTLVGGNTSDAIESFNEIIAFLTNVSDKETLGGIIAGINARIAEVEAKIPTKVSELENDKNYLTEHQSLSHLATKNELNTKQDKIEDLDAIREGASRVIPTKTSELTNDSGFLTEHQDVSHLATKEELQGKQDAIQDLNTIREGASKGATALQSIPQEYITESELDNKGYLTEHQDISHLVTHSDIQGMEEAVVQAKEFSEEAKEDADEALIKSIEANNKSIEALRQAEVATAAIATLKGLENSDEVMVEIAKEIVQISQNTSDIASIKQGTVYLTQTEYNQLVASGDISDNVEYNIFE